MGGAVVNTCPQSLPFLASLTGASLEVRGPGRLTAHLQMSASRGCEQSAGRGRGVGGQRGLQGGWSLQCFCVIQSEGTGKNALAPKGLVRMCAQPWQRLPVSRQTTGRV